MPRRHGAAEEEAASATLTVERATVSEIAHGDLTLLDPIGIEQLDEVIEAMNLPAGSHVLDVGCGRGEVLLRIAERWATCGTGIDIHEPFVEDARLAAEVRVPTGGVKFEVGDASTMTLENEHHDYDMAIAIGASHALGGDWRHALRTLSGVVPPRGGLVLLGEGFWREAPRASYLEALGATEDELPDHFALVEFAAQEGLDLLASAMTTDEQWETYELTLIDNGRRWAESHPGHPLASEMDDYVQAASNRFHGPGGRDTLGFGLFLFARKG
jgi:SAM-dependent methyltransferase